MRRRYPLHIHISTLFLALIILVGGLIGGLGYQQSREILQTSASDLTTRISRETANNLKSLLAPAEMATNLLSFDRLTQATTLAERMQSLGFLREVHRSSSALSSLYVGYPNGDFFFVRKIRSDSELKRFNAPDNTIHIVQSVDHGEGAPTGRYQYLDSDLALLRSDELGTPVLAALLQSVQSMRGSEPRHGRVTVAQDTWRSSVTPILLEGSALLYLVTAIPESELLAVSLRLVRQSALLTVLIIVLSVPITWYMARSIFRSLRALVGEAESIRHFEFSRPVNVSSLIAVVDDLALTMDSMKRAIRRFLDISLAVASEDNFERLLPRLLDEMMLAVQADAGVLYLADDGRLLPTVARRCGGHDFAAPFASIEDCASGTLLGQAIAAGQACSGSFLGV